MRFQQRLIVAVLLAALQAAAHGQDAAQTGDPDSAGAVGVVVPFVNQSAAFESELQRTNYLDFGLGLTTSFDDNTLNTPGNGKSDFTYAILPGLALRQSRGRAGWKLSYDGGYAVHQRFDTYNEGSHDLGVEGSYRLTEHLDATVEDHFRMTTGFFNPLIQGPAASPGTVLEQPNLTVVTPIAYQKSNIALVHIGDQFSPTNAIGGGATFFHSHYDNAPPGATLMDTDSQEAEAYYNHLLSRRSSIGVTYRFLRLTFTPIANDTTVNSMLVTYTLRPRQDMVFTFFGGPQHTALDNAALRIGAGTTRPAQSEVTGAGGASFVWNGRTTGVSASLMHTTSDGGGLLGPVTLTSATALLRGRLSPRLNAELGVTHGFSDSLGALGAAPGSLKSTIVSAAVMRQVSQWEFTVGYTRASQHQKTTGAMN